MKKFPLLSFFTLAYAISWFIWTPLWLPKLGINFISPLPYNHALGAIGPIAAAFIMSYVEKKNSGVKNLLGDMFRWRVGIFWHLIALLSPFAMLLLAIPMIYIMDGQAPAMRFGPIQEFPEFSFLGFFLYNIISFGYGEETGWRGYALPRLQARHNALISTLLLTIGWAGWHIPLFLYRPGYEGMNVGGIAGWFFSLLTGAILLTWLYNSTRGSILICAIFHATIDIAFTSDFSNRGIINVLGFLITVFGILVLVFAKPENLSKLERRKIFPE